MPSHCHNGVVPFLLLVVGASVSADPLHGDSAQRPEIILGALATWSPEVCLTQWQPTADYLSRAIPEARFVVRPLSYDEVLLVVDRGEIDFLVTNPALYAVCEQTNCITRVATRISCFHGRPAKTYAGVVICRAARKDLQSLESLRGKTLMAVHPWAFGGWLMALRELHELGIDVDRDLKSVRFAGRHDAVVDAVVQGCVDAGTLGANDLEKMILAGRVKRSDVRVLQTGSAAKPPGAGDCSTRVYPQWAFAKLRHTSDELAEQVAGALLQMSSDSEAARSADTAGWTIPLSYEPVHECLRQLRVGPYKHYGEVTLAAAVRAYWPWISVGCFLMAIGWSVTGTILLLNRRLRESESLRQEAEKFAASGRLAATVAHEINNPMGGIVNCLHLVKATLTPSHPAERYLVAAEKETTRIIHIVRQMLMLHRCRPEKARDFHVDAVIEDVVLMLQPLTRERSVRIELRGPNRAGPILLPEESLRQVLFNLLTNAIEASSAGDVVEVDAFQTGSSLEIIVSDIGEGIPTEILDRVVEPFFTTKTDSAAGLGLGLSISLGIVQSLGGTLNIDSRVGRGTRCALRIPLPFETAGFNREHRADEAALSTVGRVVRCPKNRQRTSQTPESGKSHG